MLALFLGSLQLGLTSFGGPIAHIGYFEKYYVRKKKWITEEDFLSLLAICQTLPGPASSQLNFLMGWKRSGPMGAFLSWLGFTLPSAIFLYCFAIFSNNFHKIIMDRAVHGLKLVAVCVVAHAVFSMAKKLCYNRIRAGIALGGMCIALIINNAASQIVVIILGGIAGLLFCKNDTSSTLMKEPNFINKKIAWGSFILFITLFLMLPILSLTGVKLATISNIFYKSGSLIFGGGHVILPLLREEFVPTGMMSDQTFLTGYGIAQAVPGPLLTIASYIGCFVATEWYTSLFWATIAIVMIFLPGMLIATFGFASWGWLGKNIATHHALAGINASVVGILAAALYNPVWTSAITNKIDIVIVLVGFFMLERLKISSLYVVLFCATLSLFIY